MKRELMTEDLSIYLPYKLMVETKGNEKSELVGLRGEAAFLDGFTYPCDVSDIQPFLRPIATAIDVIEEKSGFGIVHIGSDKELKDCDYPKERAIANAHLIASAPDLLDALQILLNTPADPATEEYQTAWFKGQEAINKALSLNN